MRLTSLISLWLFVACTLVSGDTQDIVAVNDGNMKLANYKQTQAPLHQSTLNRTLAPLKEAAPSKPMTMDATPITSGKLEEAAEHIVESVGYSKVQTNVKPEQPDMKKTEARKPEPANFEKPSKVIGFITQNGNIYEVENKDGIGLIEGRQSSDDEKTIVCNYGSIVIYSDVPCKELTGVRVGNVIETTAKGDKEENQNENQSQQQESEQNQQNAAHELEVLEAVKPLRRGNGQKRKRVQQNNLGLRRNKNRNRNRNKNRSQSPGNQNQVRRRRVQPQRRRKNQQNRRLPMQGRQANNRNQAQQQRPYRRLRKGNTNQKRRLDERLQQETPSQQAFKGDD